MRFALERVTDPEIEPFELAEAKRALDEFTDVTERDGDITDLIVAAREWVEEFTGRALIDQTWRLTLFDDAWAPTGDDVAATANSGAWNFDGESIYLRRSPILAIESVNAVAADGTLTLVDAADYELREADSKWPRLVRLTGDWSGTHRIVFRAGYADMTSSPQDDATAVPVRYKQAMKLWMRAQYDPDETMTALTEAAKNLIRGERVELGFA